MAKSPNTRKPASGTRRKNRTARAPNDIDRLVGANIRALRLDRGLTLADLASEMSISHQQLQKYETGTNRLSAGMMCAAAEVLSVEIGQLFHSKPPSEGGSDPAAKLREEAGFWVRRIRSQSNLRLAIRILKVLAS